MHIKSITEDRKELVNEIVAITGFKPNYQGAPSFAFQIGPYTVLRDGTIEVDDSEANSDLLVALGAAGFIEIPEDRIEISVPLEGHDGSSLRNLINLIYSKSELINKSTGSTFHIGDSVLAQLDESLPASKEKFLSVWETAGVNADGITFTEDKITFDFPLADDSERSQAYIELAALMNKQALDQKRIRADKSKTENEKYSFRVWLVRIGMKGEQYKKARKILLDNLSGNSAFLTADQAAAHREKYKSKKECGTKEQ